VRATHLVFSKWRGLVFRAGVSGSNFSTRTWASKPAFAVLGPPRYLRPFWPEIVFRDACRQGSEQKRFGRPDEAVCSSEPQCWHSGERLFTEALPAKDDSAPKGESDRLPGDGPISQAIQAVPSAPQPHPLWGFFSRDRSRAVPGRHHVAFCGPVVKRSRLRLFAVSY
jgi:hypothetical protein